MNAYVPDRATLGWVVVLLAATLPLGWAIGRIRSVRWARLAAWTLLVVATLGAERFSDRAPPGFRMLAIIASLFVGMKTAVVVETQAAGEPRLSGRRWLAFAATWPGMRPVLFAKRAGSPPSGARDLMWKGLIRLALGAMLLALGRLAWLECSGRLPDPAARILATLLVLPGLSLVLHFGLFNLLAGIWRWAGVDCRPLFRAPLLSRSLAEFWGRRWNLAFSEMTAIVFYRPLQRRLGRGCATALAFLGSGLLHELAISLPVKAGFGLPTCYFLLHGGLVLWENRLLKHGRPINRFDWMGLLWTLAWLALPLPILFHPWFLAGAVWPLIGMN